MTRNLLRAGALSCALLTSTALCTQPALAQTPQQFRSLDANGVDLTHGDNVLSFTEATIGSGAAALSLDRIRGGLRGSSSFDLIALRRTLNADGTLDINIERGATGERFTGPAGALTPRNADGATLTGSGDSYTHRARDGTVTVFGPPGQLEEGTSDSFCSLEQASDTTCTLVPLSITSPDGRQVQLEYDLEARRIGSDFPATWAYNYRLARVSNSFGYAIEFAYASASGSFTGNAWFERTGATLRNETLASPVVGSIGYAAAGGGAVNVTDPAGRVWRIAGTSSGITGIRRPGAASDHVSVTLNGTQVSSVTNGGVTTSYARTVNGNIATTTITDALGQQVVVESNPAIGRPTKVTDALGRVTAYQYDGNGRLTRVTAPEGNYVQYSYDARGNVVETRRVGKPGSGVADIVTSASFEAGCANPVTCNSPTSVTDARGNVTEFTYDATHGGVLSVTAPAPTAGATRPQTRYSYTLLDGEYRLTAISACASGAAPGCVGTAAESRTVIGYDLRGNVVSVEQRDGTGALSAVQTASYNAMGDVETVDGPLAGAGDTTRIRYNGAREVIGTIGPDPDGAGPLKHRASRNIISGSTGLVTRVDVGTVGSQSDADWLNMAVHQSVEADYDAHARPIVQRLTSGGTAYALSQASYDALGREECTAQRMNPAAFGSLPASACSLGAEGTFGPDRITKASYDAAGQVTQMLSAVGTPDQAVEAAMTYRANGQVERLTDGEGNRTTYVYDGHDRLKQTRYPVPQKGTGVSSTSDYEELGYDPAGNVTSRRVRSGEVLGYSYNGLNQLVLEDLPNTIVQQPDRSYGYDLLGRLVAASDTNGYQASYSYDALGRQLSEGSTWFGTRSSEYDAAGRRTKLTWNDGFFVTYDYNVLGEITAVKESGATTLATYGYDDLGRRTSLTRGNGATTGYGYDAVSRLSSLTQDAAGTANDLSLTFGYNPAGQIVSNTRNNDAYSYDFSSGSRSYRCSPFSNLVLMLRKSVFKAVSTRAL